MNLRLHVIQAQRIINIFSLEFKIGFKVVLYKKQYLNML